MPMKRETAMVVMPKKREVKAVVVNKSSLCSRGSRRMNGRTL